MSKLFSEAGEPLTKRPKRYILAIVPLILILFFIFIFMGDGWQKFFPAVEVEAISARLSETSREVSGGETLFRAAGWIEANPFSIRVTPLVDGVVKKLYIISGQIVKKDDLLAELVDDDLKFELKRAEAHLQEITSEVKGVSLKIKQEEVRIQELNAIKKSVEAIAKTAENKAERLKASDFAISKFERERAEFEYKEKLVMLEEFAVKQEVILASIEILKNELAKIEAKILSQKIFIEKLQLDIKRTKIVSPIDGIIEKVYTREGGVQMLDSNMDSSTTIATIYNQKKLQVRVDVPLSDVDKIAVGLPAKVHIEFLKEPLNGVVASISGVADYQKNTLEIKVTLNDLKENLRTEMLAQVEVLSLAKPREENAEKFSGIFIKKEALFEENKLWVVSLEQRAEIKKVVVGKLVKDGWIEIKEGLLAGEKVILNAPIKLKEGSLVKVRSLQ